MLNSAAAQPSSPQPLVHGSPTGRTRYFTISKKMRLRPLLPSVGNTEEAPAGTAGRRRCATCDGAGFPWPVQGYSRFRSVAPAGCASRRRIPGYGRRDPLCSRAGEPPGPPAGALRPSEAPTPVHSPVVRRVVAYPLERAHRVPEWNEGRTSGRTGDREEREPTPRSPYRSAANDAFRARSAGPALRELRSRPPEKRVLPRTSHPCATTHHG